MLSYLRENTGNWIIKFFLGIIVIVFVFLGVGSFGSKRNNSVATINDEPITIKEYQRAYKMLVDQMRARFGNNLNDDILKALNVKQQALDSLIEERLVLLEARKLGITISDEELQQSVLAIEAFQRDDKFNLEQYKEVLSLNSLTPEIFEESQINSLRQQKVREMLFNSVIVSEFEARNWYLFQNTKTAIDYVKFDPADYADVKLDSQEIKKYYKENSEDYKSDLKIQTKYLEFSPEDYKNEVSISDVMIKDYYQEHLQEFEIPQKVEARHILIKVEENATQEKVDSAQKQAQDIYDMAVDEGDFQELAKKYSQGPSKDNGGYLGKFEKNAMVKPFADKVFSMKKGEISTPVKTMFGWHIIQLIDRFDASTKTLEQVSKKIRKELEILEMKSIAYYKAGEAFDSVIDGDDFEQVALIAGKKIVTSSEFSIDGKGLDLSDNAGFAKAAFELSLDVISDIEQFGDSYYLIKTIKRIDPVILEFELVKERVRDEVKTKLQKEQAKKEASLYLAKALDTNTLKQLGKGKLTTTKLFNRTGSIEEVGTPDEFIKAGFSLNKDNRIYPEIIETSLGYYIIGFKERKTPDESEISKNLETLNAQILRRKQAQSYQDWIVQLKKQNKITYDPKLLKSVLR